MGGEATESRLFFVSDDFASNDALGYSQLSTERPDEFFPHGMAPVKGVLHVRGWRAVSGCGDPIMVGHVRKTAVSMGLDFFLK